MRDGSKPNAEKKRGYRALLPNIRISLIALHPEIQFDSDLIKSFDSEIEQAFDEFKKLCESTPEILEAYQKNAEVFESQENVKFDFAYKEGFR